MSKVFKFLFTFSVAALASCFSSQILLLPSNAQLISQASSTNQSPPASNELLNGVIIAVVSGIIGFLASFAIERLKEKNAPKKQISYSKVIKSGIVGNIEKDIEGKLEFYIRGS